MISNTQVIVVNILVDASAMKVIVALAFNPLLCRAVAESDNLRMFLALLTAFHVNSGNLS